jgi:hypothetical protein
MMLFIFVSAILVWVAFDRQKKRHRLELELECGRHGVEVPKVRPPVGKFEAWVNFAAGVLLFVEGGLFVWVLLQAPEGSSVKDAYQLAVLMMAGGVILAVFGARASARSKL